MTMRDPSPRRETLAEVQRMLSEARAEQIRRLVADILALAEGRDEASERRLT